MGRSERAVDIGLAEAHFDALALPTSTGRGIVRNGYGTGEQAGDLSIRMAKERLALEVATDPIGTMTMTLPEHDRSSPRMLIGSHLDSLPQGGNFDGASGIVAGSCAVASIRAYLELHIEQGPTLVRRGLRAAVVTGIQGCVGLLVHARYKAESSS